MCAKKHLLRELEILHPRLVLTYDKDAANFFVKEQPRLTVFATMALQGARLAGHRSTHVTEMF